MYFNELFYIFNSKISHWPTNFEANIYSQLAETPEKGNKFQFNFSSFGEIEHYEKAKTA